LSATGMIATILTSAIRLLLDYAASSAWRSMLGA
jgi:hypothetical protein